MKFDPDSDRGKLPLQGSGFLTSESYEFIFCTLHNWHLQPTPNVLHSFSLLRLRRSLFQLHCPTLPPSLLAPALAPSPPFVPAVHPRLHIRRDLSARARALADPRLDLHDCDGRIHVSAAEWRYRSHNEERRGAGGHAESGQWAEEGYGGGVLVRTVGVLV